MTSINGSFSVTRLRLNVVKLRMIFVTREACENTDSSWNASTASNWIINYGLSVPTRRRTTEFPQSHLFCVQEGKHRLSIAVVLTLDTTSQKRKRILKQTSMEAAAFALYFVAVCCHQSCASHVLGTPPWFDWQNTNLDSDPIPHYNVCALDSS